MSSGVSQSWVRDGRAGRGVHAARVGGSHEQLIFLGREDAKSRLRGVRLHILLPPNAATRLAQNTPSFAAACLDFRIIATLNQTGLGCPWLSRVDTDRLAFSRQAWGVFVMTVLPVSAFVSRRVGSCPDSCPASDGSFSERVDLTSSLPRPRS